MSFRKIISKFQSFSLINPLESIPLIEQANLLRNWMDGLSDLDIQVKTNAWIDRLKQKNLHSLIDYIFDKTAPERRINTFSCSVLVSKSNI